MGSGFDSAFWFGLRCCLCRKVCRMTPSPLQFGASRPRLGPAGSVRARAAAALDRCRQPKPPEERTPHLRCLEWDLTNVLQRPVQDAHHQRSLQPSPTACSAGLRAAQPSELLSAGATTEIRMELQQDGFQCFQ
ncbi:hypothetical protein MC885_020905, partial [Smutsia gigantea]